MQRLPRRGGPTLILVGFAHLFTLFVAYQLPYRCVVEIGSLSDLPFTEGFLERAKQPGFSTRWTQERSTLLFQGVEWHQNLELTLRTLLLYACCLSLLRAVRKADPLL